MFTGGLNQLINLNFTLLKPSSITGDFRYAAAGPIALLVLASFVYSISSKNRKKLNTGSYNHVATGVAEAATGLFQRSDDDELSWKSASDVLFQEDTDEIISEEADAKYAEELQVQEALLASISSSQTTDTPSSSTHKPKTLLLSSWLKKKKKKKNNDIKIPDLLCNICLENQEAWKMFKNSTCSHSFCYDCTTKHATTKIQEKNNTINCPELNCNSTLDFNTIRLIVPKDVLIKWDELLCESMILESQKLYCPFADCSVLLTNDDISITKIDCPVCRRSFCAGCRVPWHLEFTCKQFGKLKRKENDEMVVALAKKKKWMRCPKCKFFVEKSEGCLHITCRCKYEFCYNCGGKWSSNHGGCKSRSSEVSVNIHM